MPSECNNGAPPQDSSSSIAECPPAPYVEHIPIKGHYRSISSSSSVSSFAATTKLNGSTLHPTRSCSSLFGTEVTEDYRQFVKTLASHIVYGKFTLFIYMSAPLVSLGVCIK